MANWLDAKSPVWVLPGSVLILPLLAWHLDTRRRPRYGKLPA